MTFLSVIVPTKNRSTTLKHCLRTILEQETNVPYEIVVSDNCSTDDTQDVISSFDDDRIRPIQPPKRLGMTEHWEWALRHALGEWVTIVGDDDGLLPNCVERLHSLATTHDVRAISSTRHSFVWPIADHESVLRIRCGEGISIRDSEESLRLVLSGYLSHKKLPWLYTGGFVRRDVVLEIIAQRGTFFKSISPDLCSAMSLSLKEERYLFVEDPISIGGTSGFSNGLATMTSGTKSGILREFYEESAIGFLPELGDGHVQSLPLLVLEAYAVNRLDFGDLPPDLRLPYQLALTLIGAKAGFEGDVKQYCKEVARQNGVRWSNVTLLYYWLRCWMPFGSRVLRYSRRSAFIVKGSRTEVLHGVSDNIYEASQEAWHVCGGIRQGSPEASE